MEPPYLVVGYLPSTLRRPPAVVLSAHTSARSAERARRRFLAGGLEGYTLIRVEALGQARAYCQGGRMSKPAPYAFREGLRRRLYEARRRAAHTQQTLADHMGIHAKTVASIEQGIALPNAHTLALWCRACGCGVDALLEGVPL